MPLQFRQSIDLPPHETGGFDHADVHTPSGHVFLAHTALGQVEMSDGVQGARVGTVSGCPEASGVLYAPEADEDQVRMRKGSSGRLLAALSRAVLAGASRRAVASD